jgi:hypothetical protein
MPKSEYEYEIVDLGFFDVPKANTELKKRIDEGWEVQQIFTNRARNGSDCTLALMRRKPDKPNETYTHTGF